jgi:hypothetical protein
MNDRQVGLVTMAEIADAILGCQDDLNAKSIYQAIVKLHLSKTGPTKIKVLLDDLANSRSKLEVISKSDIRCEWFVYLYNVVIAIILVKKIDDEESKEVYREVYRDSWGKMLDSLYKIK